MLTSRQRFILLETIIIGLVILGAAFGLGKVEEKTSYGLTNILMILGVVAPIIARGGEKKEKEEEPPKET